MPNQEEGIKILRFEFRDFMGIDVMEYDASEINIFAGGNGKCKTSALDGIQKAINNYDNPRPKTVRGDCPEATLFVELSNGVKIERTLNSEDSSKDKVKIIDSFGVTVKQPEGFLKKLMGQYRFGFNPVAFIFKPEKEQTQILLSLLPITVTQQDLKAWFVDEVLFPEGLVPPVNCAQHGLQVCKDLANEKGGWLYDKRAVVNKEVDLLESEIASIIERLPDNYKISDWEDISLMDKSTNIQNCLKINSYRDAAQKVIDEEAADLLALKTTNDLDISKRNDEHRLAIEGCNTEIQRLEKLIEQQKSYIKSHESRLATDIEALKSNLEMLEIDRQKRTSNARLYLRQNLEIDIAPLNEEFANIETMRSYIPSAKDLEKLNANLEVKQYEAAVWNRFVSVAREKPKEMLSRVTLPVEGLDVDSEGKITFDGLPLLNKSTGEQLKIAMKIALATLGEFKFMNVDKLECLDVENRKLVYQIAKSQGIQLFGALVTGGEMTVTKE